MHYKQHLAIEGKHAIISPSNYHWVDKDNLNDILTAKLKAYYATELGTAVHLYAKDRIQAHMKLTKSEKNGVLFSLIRDQRIPRRAIDIDYIFPNLMNYVNDAIALRMDPEIVLAYSSVAFGTADTIKFENDILRIHDLKTGISPVSMKQLEQYAALFFLEYGEIEDAHPEHTRVELRIYQNNDVQVLQPEPERILSVMDQIVYASDFVQKQLMEG